jgi:hypothetical protein
LVDRCRRQMNAMNCVRVIRVTNSGEAKIDEFCF